MGTASSLACCARGIVRGRILRSGKVQPLESRLRVGRNSHSQLSVIDHRIGQHLHENSLWPRGPKPNGGTVQLTQHARISLQHLRSRQRDHQRQGVAVPALPVVTDRQPFREIPAPADAALRRICGWRRAERGGGRAGTISAFTACWLHSLTPSFGGLCSCLGGRRIRGR